MSEPNYPKILIFSQPFNSYSGGGITLTNLFKGWARENLAVISYPFMLFNISTDPCNTYYQIGQEELHWVFPFSLFKPKYRSGLITSIARNTVPVLVKGRNIRHFCSVFLLNPLISWLGLSHCVSHIHISRRLDKWLSEFNPTILYFQISNRESINFAVELINHLQIPSVLHMMDDWPSSIADGSIFRYYWKGKVARELQQLMDKVDVHLSICDEMSAEYQKRYGFNFHAFHNTIELDRWMRWAKKDLNIHGGTMNVLFSGRIGKGIQQSLVELADAIDTLRRMGFDITLQIQSPRSDPAILDQLKSYECVSINSTAEYERIPEIYSMADILVIANDFHPKGIKFLKYSMPTKVPEYMISGTPILVYASPETALFKFFHQNKCGHCVGIQSKEEIVHGIKLLFQDIDYREELSQKAIAFAKEFFDSDIVRQRFHSLLRNL